MTYLLDVNVLIALIDRKHQRHQDAHAWLDSQSNRVWATSPLTENGLIRIISNKAYPSPATSIDHAGALLRVFCQTPSHVFWNEDLSILDTTTFDLTHVTGHRQVTDVYLAALARRHGGKLATFDRTIPIHALIGDSSDVLEIIEAT